MTISSGLPTADRFRNIAARPTCPIRVSSVIFTLQHFESGLVIAVLFQRFQLYYLVKCEYSNCRDVPNLTHNLIHETIGQLYFTLDDG